MNKIGDIIACHRGCFSPREDIAVPAAVLRIADKLDKINKNKLDDFVITYTKSMRLIEESFKCSDNKDYEKLRETCEIVKIQLIAQKTLQK